MKVKHHPHDHATRLGEIVEKLKRSGLKLTKPRQAILGVLVENHGPFTAEEIHKLVTKRVCDQATIYRCLASLEEANLIVRCEFGDGTARFEIAELDGHHHHHLICNKCKHVEIIEDCQFAAIDRTARKHGFSDISHKLEFFGTCPKCQ